MQNLRKADAENIGNNLECTAIKIDNAKGMVEFLATALGKGNELLDFPEQIENTLLVLAAYLEDVPENLNEDANLLYKDFHKNKKEVENGSKDKSSNK